MTDNFPKILSYTKLQIWELTEHHTRKNAKKLYLGVSFPKYIKSKIKKKIRF